jgi:hypothetical protein
MILALEEPYLNLACGILLLVEEYFILLPEIRQGYSN